MCQSKYLVGPLVLLAMGLGEAGPAAAAAGWPQALRVSHYDVTLTPDFAHNAMATRVLCTVRNEGKTPVDQLGFYILAREKRVGVAVDRVRVAQRAAGRESRLEFSRDAVGRAPANGDEHGKMVRVRLASALQPRGAVELVFEYRWRSLNAASQDNYVLFATLPNGEKEVCLHHDFTWIPEVEGSARNSEADCPFSKAEWVLTAVVPAGYDVAAMDGEEVASERRGEQVVARWRSRVPGKPQVVIGRYDRIALKRQHAAVNFWLPKGGYQREAIEHLADLLDRAYQSYSECYGRLEHREIHVCAGGAGSGGHGGYLSILFCRDTGCLRKQVQAFDAIAAHELAHTWWGGLVTGYGRGWRFLHESLAEYAACDLARRMKADFPWFQDNLARLFWMGRHTGAVIYPDQDDEYLVYHKGPLVLDVLRSEMGDEAFYRALQEYARRFRGRSATFADFAATWKDASGKDWTPFFDRWLLRDGGCPDYRVVGLRSEEAGGQWRTVVQIRNAGQGAIQCPVDLQMASGAKRISVRVPEGETRSFEHATGGQVRQAVVDPEHCTYQGSGRERRLKMLPLKNSGDAGIRHRRALVNLELGHYDEAIVDLSWIIAIQTALPEGERWVWPSPYYCRGMAHLHKGDTKTATADLAAFVDGVLKDSSVLVTCFFLCAPRPDEQRSIHRALYGDASAWTAALAAEHLRRLNEILRRLTGHDVTFEPSAADPDKEWQRAAKEWQGWWRSHREGFTLGARARSLPPDGFPGSKADP